MSKQKMKVDVQIFKGEKNKTFIVFPVFTSSNWADADYKAEANKILKKKCSDLTLKDGYVLNKKDLYWSVKDMPDDLKDCKVKLVKVVYKK